MYLPNTTSILQCARSSAASIDSTVCFIEYVKATGVAVDMGNKQCAAFASAATGTCLAAPGASNCRSVKKAWWRNKHATLSCDVEILLNDSADITTSLHKATLAPGDTLEYIENVGFFVVTNLSSLVIDANANTADVVANAADTYLTGSSLNVTGLLQAGAFFRWRFSFNKTAAGIATPIFNLRFGTAGTTGDTSRGTHTFLAQTAATDTGVCEIEAVVRAVGASGQIQSFATLEHINTTTGLANAAQIQIKLALSATFDTTPSGSIIGISCNPGASGVWTFQTCTVTGRNLVKQR